MTQSVLARGSATTSKMPKYILLCCLVVIQFPSNSLTKPSANTTTVIHHSTAYSEKTVHPLATGSIVSLLITSAIVSNVLLVSILSYLNNLSLEKECLLLYLYKDFVTLFIIWNCVWLLVCILYYPIHNYFKFGEIQATIVTGIIWCLTLMLVLVINAVSAIRCYMMRSTVLDPWGEDENVVLKRIRVGCGVLTVGFSSTMFSLGLYAKIYYFFAGEDPSVLILPTTASIFPGVLTLLIVSCSITSLVARLFESSNIQSIDKVITRQINNFIFVALPVALLFSFSDSFNLIEPTNRYNVVVGLMSITMISIPAAVIIKTDQLKFHVIRILKNSMYEALLLNIYLVPAFLMLIINGIIYLCF